MMTQLFAHPVDDRDDGRLKYWDGGFRGHAWCDSRILSGWRDQRILGFQVLLEAAVAGRLVRTKAEVIASVERGGRECRYSGRFGDRNLRDSA